MNYQKFECVICGHIYDEEFGDPDGGIPAGTKWEDIPDDWVCPDCGVSKFDYEPMDSYRVFFLINLSRVALPITVPSLSKDSASNPSGA